MRLSRAFHILSYVFVLEVLIVYLNYVLFRGNHATSKVSKPTTSIPSILLFRNEIRLQLLQKYYSEYFNVSSFNSRKSTKTMIYSCRGACSGWGDRLRGIMSVFILALLTQRRFMIDMKYPCPITEFLEPNLVNWTYVWLASKPGQNRTGLTLRTGVLGKKDVEEKLFDEISNKNFVSIWEPYDDIWFTTTEYYIEAAVRNPYINSSSLFGRLPLENATNTHLFSFLYEMLFKPKANIVHAVDEVLNQVFGPLVCCHLRFGKNPSLPHDSNLPKRKHLSRRMIDFLLNLENNFQLNESSLFVASDSELTVQKMQNFFPKMLAPVPGPIIHIDRILWGNESGNIAKRCDGFKKVIVEFYILGECDVSILSNSGLSMWASRRRINTIDHIYVHNDTSGELIKTIL